MQRTSQSDLFMVEGDDGSDGSSSWDNDASSGEEDLAGVAYSSNAALRADFLRIHNGGRPVASVVGGEPTEDTAGTAGESIEQHHGEWEALEHMFGAPGHFATVATNFRSAFFNPLEALYSDTARPPVTAIRPLDNVHKASVLVCVYCWRPHRRDCYGVDAALG